MTLRTDLAALLADTGIIDADIDKAVEDEHVRSHIYRKVITVAVASRSRDGDRAIVAAILRDPVEMVSKSAVVELVDQIAARTADPAEFQQWAAGLMPEVDRRLADEDRGFIRDRIRDWTLYLAIKAGRMPTTSELTNVTDWMQRFITRESTSLPLLTLLAEVGNTKKIRNVARNRARSRAVRSDTVSPA